MAIVNSTEVKEPWQTATASSPITSWQTDGEMVETVADFILGGSKITSDGDFSHEIKRYFSLKKNYDQLRQHIKKQRHYFADKVPSSQSYGFSIALDVRAGV